MFANSMFSCFPAPHTDRGFVWNACDFSQSQEFSAAEVGEALRLFPSIERVGVRERGRAAG